ncbi:hypothetical protein PHYBOEH_007925 [Phytophthora boehmeriae]|uniref:Mitochondrial fission protein ELM1 n=1 Tax=Phytophthora boehmeriae TaxID=109152 RepID=A0A8T1X0G5_9STRA|nr:hypothetical protein PHYBOEH_007925 [Phytophthora boehmeriae]
MTLVRVLVLGNGAAGAEKQALALAARLREKILSKASCHNPPLSSPPVECVRVTLGRSRLVPPVLQTLGARLTNNPLFGYTETDRARLVQVQKPRKAFDIVIGCGRSTVALCAVLKLLNPSKTFNIQIQHPRVPLTWFDAVVAPRHDFPVGHGGAANLFLTSGTVHDITPELLKLQGQEWSRELKKKPQGRRKRVVWLLGGPCRGFAFTVQAAERMVDEFVRAVPRDAAVLVTFSRRTPKDVQRIIRNGLAEAFTESGQVLVWDGTEKRNPYYALLFVASCIVTTPDSISMTTEAIASGKPVLTISVEHATGKFQYFHQSLFERSWTTPFTRDAVEAALKRCAADEDCHERGIASIALEKEISTIVNDIADNLHMAIDKIQKT